VSLVSSQINSGHFDVSGSFSVGLGASDDLRDFLSVFSPLVNKTAEGHELRINGFKAAKSNFIDLCSLTNLEHFIKKILNTNFKSNRGIYLFDYFRYTFIFAFNAAKAIDSSTDRIDDAEEYVSFSAFRLFNAYLCLYATMYDAFCEIDSCEVCHEKKKGDGKIKASEWLQRYKRVNKHGFIAIHKIKGDNHAKNEFKSMDKDGLGKVLLKEWCDFLTFAEIENNTELGKLLSKILKLVRTATKKYSQKDHLLKKSTPSVNSKPIKVIGLFTIHQAVAKGLRDFVNVFEPYTVKSKTGHDLRHGGFKYADNNDIGYCSIVELENFIQFAIVKKFGDAKEGSNLFQMFSGSFTLAFNAAKVIDNNDDDERANQYVSFTEFRMFNIYLCIYAAMCDTFFKISVCCTASEKIEDQKISYFEWSCGHKRVINCGFVGFKNITDTNNVEFIYKIMDKSGYGMVIFKDWCDYIISAEIHKNTELGKLLSGILKPLRKPYPGLSEQIKSQ